MFRRRAAEAVPFAHRAWAPSPAHLLVPAEGVFDGGRTRQRLVDLHGCAAGVCKQRVHALPLQRLDQDIGALAGLVPVAVDPVDVA